MTLPVFAPITGANNPFKNVDVGYDAAPTFVDLDGDGDREAVIGNSSGYLLFYLNNNGKWVEKTGIDNPFNNFYLGYDAVPAFTDIEGDGDPDAIVGNGYGQLQFFLNEDGTFVEVTGTGNPFSNIYVDDAAPIFLNIDADNDADLIIGEYYGTLKLYRNNKGVFVEVTGNQNPFNNIDVGNSASPAFTDMDADGDQDLIVGNSDGKIFYYQNNKGTFVEKTGFNNPLYKVDVGYNAKPTIIDVDSDGDEDVIVGNSEGNIFYFRNENENNEIIGTAQTDVLYGTFADNLLKGLPGNDALMGFEGNDTLDGGTGADVMVGGKNNDIYIVDNAGDIIVEAQGEGNDLVKSNFNYTIPENIEQLILTGNNNINATGDDKKNNLTGNNKNNTLKGKGKQDTLLGKDGNDLLDGGADADKMEGGKGNDIYIVDHANDKVIEQSNEGSDLVKTSLNYTLVDNVEKLIITGNKNINGTGNKLANIITGNNNNNTLNGGSNNDQLLGESGQDVLIGGAGNDTLTGGNGQDSFIFNSPNEGIDSIKDFNKNLDIIRISQNGFGAGLGIGVLPSNKFVLGTAAKDSNDRFIYNPNNGNLFFDNNGSANGGTSHLATLTGAPDLTSNNILIL